MDGTFAGVLNVRSAGTIALPRRFRGNPNLISQLELGHDSVRSVYQELIPPDQAKLMVQDGIGMGVAVGEIIPVPGRSYGVLRRLPPEGLRYRWASTQGNWFYSSSAGQIPIIKGDGRWVLWEPGGTDAAPWERGAWIYSSRAYINKEHAILEAANFIRTLANPAVLTTTPQGASDTDRTSWFQAFANWGSNMVASAPVPGFDAKVLEIQGQGYKAFKDMIDTCNKELITAIAGQEVTTTGGSGFISSNLFQSIREDLIKETADSWAHLVNTQIIPPWVVQNYGVEALDLTQIANSWTSSASALVALNDALLKLGRELDLDEAIARLGLPVKVAKELTRFDHILNEEIYSVDADASDGAEIEDALSKSAEDAA
jgi:hypothetical protein